MYQIDLASYLQNNSYPGRGVLLGMHQDGKHGVIAYFIMGRSENSRNRVFVAEGEDMKTQAFDPAKVVDPSLIIYYPVLDPALRHGGHQRRPDRHGVRRLAHRGALLARPAHPGPLSRMPTTTPPASAG